MTIQQIKTRVTKAMARKRWAAAVKFLNVHTDLVMNDWTLAWNLGWCHFKLDQFVLARKYMKRATSLAPQDGVALWGLGVVYLKLNRHKSADLYLRRSLAIKDRYITRLCLASSLLKQKRLVDAGKVYADGIRRRPKEWRLYEAFGDLLSDAGQEERASVMYKKAKAIKATRKSL